MERNTFPVEEVIALALAWQDAVNRQDPERLRALSTHDIEIAGPRGSGRGHMLLVEWLARANADFATLRIFARGTSVVLEQRATWRAVETGAAIGQALIASRLSISGGQIAFLARHDSLSEALAAAGLDLADEHDPGH